MKYIFIDTNQYRHIFSASEGFSDTVSDLLVKLTSNDHCRLLLPQQTWDEVERNRVRKWPREEERKLAKSQVKLSNKLENLTENYADFKAAKTLAKEISRVKERKEKDIIRARKKYLNPLSKQNKKLKKLFKKAIVLELDSSVIEKAKDRSLRGNPPYESPSKKIGDAIIWESLLDFLSAEEEKGELIFVANDKVAWGDQYFDPWLKEEFEEKTGMNLIYTHALADIPEFTEEEQKKLRVEENLQLRKDTISSFVNSNSFDEAGRNARALLKYKGQFTEEEIMEVFDACLSNNQIYLSYNARQPVKMLFLGKDGYAEYYADLINSVKWDMFSDYFNVSYKRHIDEIIEMYFQGEISVDESEQ